MGFHRSFCFLLTACSLLAVALFSPSGISQTVTAITAGHFSVTDERAPEELSEISRLYLNGHLAATFRLGLGHDRQDVILPVPAGRSDIPYALCGEITIRHNGHTETHQVSSEGILHTPEGHSYDAVGSEHFTDFFLVDYNDPDAADHGAERSGQCALPGS